MATTALHSAVPATDQPVRIARSTVSGVIRAMPVGSPEATEPSGGVIATIDRALAVDAYDFEHIGVDDLAANHVFCAVGQRHA